MNHRDKLIMKDFKYRLMLEWLVVIFFTVILVLIQTILILV